MGEAGGVAGMPVSLGLLGVGMQAIYTRKGLSPHSSKDCLRASEISGEDR